MAKSVGARMIRRQIAKNMKRFPTKVRSTSSVHMNESEFISFKQMWFVLGFDTGTHEDSDDFEEDE